MYDFIKGISVRLDKERSALTIESNSIGYEVFVHENITIAMDENIMLYTHLSVSETNMSLYGFTSRLERDVFRLLLRVSGLGPKLALRIMAAKEAKALLGLLSQGSSDALSELKGLGEKTAKKIILELGKKATKMLLHLAAYGEEAEISHGLAMAYNKTELVAALKDLGYREGEATQASHEALKFFEENAKPSLEELLAVALKQIGEKRSLK